MYHFLIVGVLLAVHTDYTQAVCGNVPVVWRNDNMTCPERAICADVFDTVRDWLNGTRCEERRILSNCLCPGGTVCPTSSSRHMLYASRKHKQFICRPACSLPWCGNVNEFTQRGQRHRTGRRRSFAVALTAVQNAHEFGDKTYYRMGCRCPRHHFPDTNSRRARAVKAYRYEYNYSERRYSTLFTCDSRPSERGIPDPCGHQGAVRTVTK